MDKLQLRRASLIGNSIGGRIAWMFAATQQARVANLVLISPDGFASLGFEYNRKVHVPNILKLLKYALPKPLLRMNLEQAYGDPVNLTNEVVERYYDLMLAPGVRAAMIDRLAQTVLVDPVPLLGRIRAPTLILWGEKDALIPVSNSDDYLRSIPRSTLVRLPGLGHVPQEEAPLDALAPVREFLIRNIT
jgi:pimeloyl-ACP methyl ester carboxylesterase